MAAFWTILACLIALNAWMTRRVPRAGPLLDHKGLLVAGVWIAPFFGALMVRMHMTNRGPAGHADAVAPAPAPEQPAAPLRIDAPCREALDLQACLLQANGWVALDWAVVDAWLEGIADPADRQAARLACQRAWLMHLRDAMGPHAALYETEGELLLSTLDPRTAQATAEFVARTRQRVSRVLGSLAAPEPGFKSILVVFDSEDDYYHYAAAYDGDEGESAFSGGMFIHAGCPHFVTRRDDLARIEPVIAHEMTHAALAHLRLPLWLDEGIAVNTEHRLTGATRGEHTPQQMQRLHQRFWGEAEIQQFWDGSSFRRPDEGNKLSYDLARIIVEQLGKTWEPFAAFVASAQRQDAGAQAARDTLGIDLGAFVCALLERDAAPTWSPALQPPVPMPSV